MAQGQTSPAVLTAAMLARSEERRVGKECRSRCDWSSDVCSSDLDKNKWRSFSPTTLSDDRDRERSRITELKSIMTSRTDPALDFCRILGHRSGERWPRDKRRQRC